MSIALKIKELRLAKNLTQQQASDHLGLPRTTYSSYELGKAEPDIALLTKMSSLFDVSTDVLLNIDNTSETAVTVSEPPMQVYKPARFDFNCILVDNIASAGSVSFNDIGTSKGTPTFIPNLAKRPTPYIMLAVSGRSMEPQFHDGDFVVCYELRDQSQVMADTVHIVTSSEGIYLKEVRYLNERSGDPNAGLLRLKSLNERYDNVYLDPKESNVKLYRVVTVLHMV